MPRPLLPAEEAKLKDLDARLPVFLDERYPVLADFFSTLGRGDAALVAANPEDFVAVLDLWAAPQDFASVSQKDHIWLMVRIGYLVGEVLVGWGQGVWMLDRTPDSATFGRYVIGAFSAPVAPDLSIDPMAVAISYLSMPPGRSLRILLDGLRSTHAL